MKKSSNRRRIRLLGLTLCLFLLYGCDKKEEQAVNDTKNVETVASAEPVTSAEPVESLEPVKSEEPAETTEPYEPVTLCFAGDINMDDRFSIMQHYRSVKNGMEDCFSSSILETMRNADIMMLNNEFPYSERGKAIPGKDYTFCSKPENVKLLLEMGVDTVSLANNHTLDYGFDAFADTMQTLQNANIRYSGAGQNVQEAASPVVYECQGKQIGYLSASKVLYQGNQMAGKDNEGLLSAYDPTALEKWIKKAKKQCDYLIVYLHWGVEYKEKPESWQKEWARRFIDAGADAIIGCHPHVIQGVEFYNGKPIVYSLGNYWFNSASKYSMLVKLQISEENETELTVVPCKNQGARTLELSKTEQKDYFQYLKKISFGVDYSEDGVASHE